MTFGLSKVRGMPSPGALLLAVVLGIYSFLPIIGVKPVAIEGFEAAVTDGVNQVVLMGKVGFSRYNFDNRPGEFLLYEAIQNIVPVDALWIGAACSALAYVAAIVGVALLARRLAFASVISALIAFFLMFDVTAAAAQVSSSTLAEGLFVLGCAFLTFSSPIGQLLGLMACAYAVFSRLDVFFLVPVVLMLALVRFRSIGPALQYGVLWTIGIYAIALLMYRSVGLHIISNLRGSGSGLSFFQDWAVQRILASLFPYAVPLGVAGMVLDARRHWNEPLVLFGRTALCLGPMLVIALIYSGRADSPRFLVTAYPFLALAAAVSIDAAILGFSRLGPLKSVCALVVLLLAVGITWFIRKPMIIWDGFRYQWANYSTPAEILELKTYLAHSNALMEKAVFVPPSVVGGLAPTREVLATSWRRYNDLAHAAAMQGNGLEGNDSIKLVPDRPAVGCSLYTIRNVHYRICLVDEGREYKGMGEARTLISQYLKYRPSGLIVGDLSLKEIADDSSLHLQSSLLSSNDHGSFYSVLLISTGG